MGGEDSDKRTAPRSVLFLCGQNAIRSPIAESLARARLSSNIFIASAGVRAGERDPFVDAVLDDAGLPPRSPRTVALEDMEDAYFDLIVTLAPEAHHAALELTRTMAIDVEYWPTPDPSVATGTRAQIMEAYRDVLNRLRGRIEARFARETGPETRD
ncbi:MAG: arsenate-mycothiol transferase ArsC [Rhizobiaceae bacterium]